MPTLIVPIGFSGSGKTTYYNRYYTENSIYISKDNLRIQYLHDVNDQSQNKRIAIMSNQLLIKTIENNIASDVCIYYDNINVGILSTIKKLMRDYPSLNVKIVLFMDSLKPQLRIQRIQNDLNNGVVRANTVDVIAENYENEIKMFKSNYNSVLRYYSQVEDPDIIERLKVVKFQNNKPFTLYRK